MLDFAHLDRQTMGDEVLRKEVLDLFIQQMATARSGLATADTARRREIAHRLCGSARAVGAFALAETASDLEAAPASEHVFVQLAKELEELAAVLDLYLR